MMYRQSELRLVYMQCGGHTLSRAAFYRRRRRSKMVSIDLRGMHVILFYLLRAGNAVDRCSVCSSGGSTARCIVNFGGKAATVFFLLPPASSSLTSGIALSSHRCAKHTH